MSILEEKLDLANERIAEVQKSVASLHERFDRLPCHTTCPGDERRKNRKTIIAAIMVPLAAAVVSYVATQVHWTGPRPQIPAPAMAHS